MATCARAAFRDRPAGELRVTLKSYNGNAFVDVRVWDAARDRVTFFPSKAGASIRRGELRAVIEGLTAAAREMGVELDGEEADRG